MGQACLQCKYKSQVENVQKNKIKRYLKTITLKPGDVIVAHYELMDALKGVRIKNHPDGKFDVPIIFTNDVRKKIQVIETKFGNDVGEKLCSCADVESDCMDIAQAVD